MQLSSARLGAPSNGLQTPEDRNRTSCPVARRDFPAVISTKSIHFNLRDAGDLLLGGGPSRIPLSAALLAWRLLIARSGEEDAVDAIAISRRPTQPAVFPPSALWIPTFQVTIPKPPLAANHPLAKACDEVVRCLAQPLQQSDGRLGTEVGIDTTLCFSHGSTSEHVAQRRNGKGFEAQATVSTTPMGPPHPPAPIAPWAPDACHSCQKGPADQRSVPLR